MVVWKWYLLKILMPLRLWDRTLIIYRFQLVPTRYWYLVVFWPFVQNYDSFKRLLISERELSFLIFSFMCYQSRVFLISVSATIAISRQRCYFQHPSMVWYGNILLHDCNYLCLYGNGSRQRHNYLQNDYHENEENRIKKEFLFHVY